MTLRDATILQDATPSPSLPTPAPAFNPLDRFLGPSVRRLRFESPILHSARLHHLAPGRKPLQNRGFFMRGQSGLRPSARQNGRVLQRILQRYGEVVVSPKRAASGGRRTPRSAVWAFVCSAVPSVRPPEAVE